MIVNSRVVALVPRASARFLQLIGWIVFASLVALGAVAYVTGNVEIAEKHSRAYW